jgi:flagellar biosynthesis/type III secretory pathway protein FliH
MKSSSRIHSLASQQHINTWNVADLDVKTNVSPAEVQSEHILAFFGKGSKTTPSQQDTEPHSPVHRRGADLALTNWMPADIDLLPKVAQTTDWEFVEPTSDFFNIPEQQVWKEKFDAEKERIEIIKNARAQAEAILNEARAEAGRIIEQAQTQAQDEMERSRKEAYESVHSELKSALSATHVVIEETHQWQAELMKNSEQTLMDMLKEIAQTIFGEGVRLDPNALQVNLNRVMDNAHRLGDLKIFLNPEDANALDPSWTNYQLLITGNKVRIVHSEKIKPGGCVIKGSTGMVDARVETQLSAVLNAIDEVDEVSR